MNLALCLEESKRQWAGGAVKTEDDLDRYRLIIDKTKPDVLIECGTFSGKSAAWFAQYIPHVVTVDMTARHIHDETREEWAGKVEMVVADSASRDATHGVRNWLTHWGAQRIMVVLDSDHSTSHVSQELQAYAPLVAKGCYCVVEDGLVRWMPNHPYIGDPLEAIGWWMGHEGSSLGFEIDTVIEGYRLTTQHPAGWLRRRT